MIIKLSCHCGYQRESRIQNSGSIRQKQGWLTRLARQYEDLVAPCTRFQERGSRARRGPERSRSLRHARRLTLKFRKNQRSRWIEFRGATRSPIDPQEEHIEKQFQFEEPSLLASRMSVVQDMVMISISPETRFCTPISRAE